jgi:3-hydroxy-D-aspartate aldolase
MKDMTKFDGLEVGYDIPALPGMDEADIQTPCLCSTSTRWSATSRRWATTPRPTACATGCMARCTSRSTWRSCRMELGGACGVCCQKVSEAEVFARGGIKDVLVSNQVRDPAKIDRLARMPKLGARTICCVDDLANVADLSAAAVKHGTRSNAWSRSTAARAAAA